MTTLGIDLAVRAAHVATLTDERGKLVWKRRRFFNRQADLVALSAAAGPPEQLTVVMEPTRNSWALVAAHVKAQGAKVVLVAPEQAADLRRYYNKHAKNDHLDPHVLARLPLLHPEGLAELASLGPADALKRSVRRRATLVADALMCRQRLDSLLDLLGPGYVEVLSTRMQKSALEVLEHHGDPRALRRLGLARRSAQLYDAADPKGIVALAPGVGPVLSAGILGRLGDAKRLANLGGVRGFSGLVPGVAQSGNSEQRPGITKQGDPGLRRDLWPAAELARHQDPQLAAKYYRLIVVRRLHHYSAICHLATALLTRIADCWRSGQLYVVRDTDGTPVGLARQAQELSLTLSYLAPAVTPRFEGLWLWPLISVHLASGHFAAAVEAACWVLESPLSRPPDDIVSLVRGAKEARDYKEEKRATRMLSQAVELASQLGYC